MEMLCYYAESHPRVMWQETLSNCDNGLEKNYEDLAIWKKWGDAESLHFDSVFKLGEAAGIKRLSESN